MPKSLISRLISNNISKFMFTKVVNCIHMIYKRILVSLSLLVVVLSGVLAQDYKVYDFDTLEPLLHAKNKKVYVVNF